jgi:CRP-like cAMP-binding protein
MVDAAVLKQQQFFKVFSEAELKVLSGRLNLSDYEPQATIFNENQIGDDSMYIIVQGAVKIVKKNKTEEIFLANLRDGDCFGEMSMLYPAPRSASAVTIKASKLIRFTDRDYNDFNKTQPSIVVKLNEIFIKTLVTRLRDADKRLVKEGSGIGAL